jgi:hypothetical protein
VYGAEAIRNDYTEGKVLGVLYGCGGEVDDVEEEKERGQHYVINLCAKHRPTRDGMALAMAPLDRLPCRAHGADEQHEEIVWYGCGGINLGAYSHIAKARQQDHLAAS